MKTFSELNITEAEHIALQAVAAGLASGQYAHAYEGEGAKTFDMYMKCDTTSCGTVGCIGGWVGREMGLSIDASSAYVDSVEGSTLEQLYYPETSSSWSAITPHIASDAIYNFLETGHPDFEALLAAQADANLMAAA